MARQFRIRVGRGPAAYGERVVGARDDMQTDISLHRVEVRSQFVRRSEGVAFALDDEERGPY